MRAGVCHNEAQVALCRLDAHPSQRVVDSQGDDEYVEVPEEEAVETRQAPTYRITTATRV